jgi:hypothetical protein
MNVKCGRIWKRYCPISSHCPDICKEVSDEIFIISGVKVRVGTVNLQKETKDYQPLHRYVPQKSDQKLE